VPFARLRQRFGGQADWYRMRFSAMKEGCIVGFNAR